jgi:hypothetical protein
MLKITDVELLKKQARRTAAGRVLSGDVAEVGLDLGRTESCRTYIAAGYGRTNEMPKPLANERLIWILDGFMEINEPGGRVTTISQGESTILARGRSYRLDFPQLCLYLCVEARTET